ncbi:MAG: TonB-dependent receptor plug domain-containing protein, partial [Acidobacteria bacterium]|nr:TonB-dependent receptor plug domain-containing protein [Acidobacteriota bacterium]
MRVTLSPLSLLCSLVGPLLAAGLATPVAAQQGSGEPDRAERVEESLEVEDSFDYLPTSNTIVSKLPTDQVWTPANIGVVDSVLIEEQNGQVLGDALSNLSGVNVQTGSGVFDFFVLRGFDSLSSALVLTDGVPEPESTFYQLYNVERVEIFKGPAGFLYGSNPLAGVVNLVRKQPLPHSLASFGIGWGSFDTTEASFDLNAASAEGRTSFRLNGLWRESDGYRDGRDYNVSAVHPVFAWRPDERQALTVSLELSSSDYRPDAGLPLLAAVLPDVPRERSYASPLDQSLQDIVRIQVDYEV